MLLRQRAVRAIRAVDRAFCRQSVSSFISCFDHQHVASTCLGSVPSTVLPTPTVAHCARLSTLPALPDSTQYGSLSSKLHSFQKKQGFASKEKKQTKAEEFDLITDEPGLVRVEGYDDNGFYLNGEMYTEGAVTCVGNLCTSWNVSSWKELSASSLALLHIIKPPPEIVVLGLGRHLQQLPKDVMQDLADRGIMCDVGDTRNALATYNFLCQEKRAVVGAFLPYGS